MVLNRTSKWIPKAKKTDKVSNDSITLQEFYCCLNVLSCSLSHLSKLPLHWVPAVLAKEREKEETRLNRTTNTHRVMFLQLLDYDDRKEHSQLKELQNKVAQAKSPLRNQENGEQTHQ